METRLFPALIHKDKDSDYGISFPDVPGCVSAGGTIEEAVILGTEALQFHLDGLREEGGALPVPSAIESVERGDSCAVVLIPAVAPSRARRINITMEENLVAAIDQAAGARNRSAFIAEAARAKLTATGRFVVTGEIVAAKSGGAAISRSPATGKFSTKRESGSSHFGRKKSRPAKTG
jgi:predicted RNase H-like HicB family nuclease